MACYTAIVFLCIASTAGAYIDAPPEKLTIPMLIKEFKTIAVLKLERADERGKAKWEIVRVIQGKPDANGPGARVRQSITLDGKVPEELKQLKPGVQAVFFSEDNWNRSLTLVEGNWYVCEWDAKTGWWRMSYTAAHYDFNCCFVGTTKQLADAIDVLRDGKSVTVRCRKVRRKPEMVEVTYRLDRPEQKEQK